jgi:diguanylate cyclase (GGDEF)-like protein
LKHLGKRLEEAFDLGSYEGEMRIPSSRFPRKRWIALKVVRAVSDLALTVRDVSEAKAHAKELDRRSNVDALTGLPNRHWLQTYLSHAIDHASSSKGMFALLFIDLDGFKAINDATGHATGDDLLRAIAHRLTQAVDRRVRVIRLGGDEFVAVTENIESKSDAAHAAERLTQSLKEPFSLPQGTYSLSASIGISMYPSDGLDASTLLRNADIAMYSVKSSGKANYRFYDPDYFERARTRLQIENELRHAIDTDQFVMYYQPRADIATGSLRSMEALVRWAHPSKGLISPEQFIPIANETGLISKLGELVIDKVCAQVSSWTKTYHYSTPVSINVAPLQFEETDVAAIFQLAFSRHRLDPRLIEIEITESSIMADRPDVYSALNRLQEMNVKLAIDDFGTGYSSLSQLQKLNFDLLKVDKSFISRISGTHAGTIFVSAIITMAHALNMRVVAEGVETKNQLEILRSLDCDEVQGYYISRPVPPSHVPAMLKDLALQDL